MGRPNRYHNDWIFAHYDPNVRWSNLLKDYNDTFGTSISYPTFVSYLNRSLNIQQEFCYTEEQDTFLKETYPPMGRDKTASLFNARFGTKRTPNAIGHRCRDILGLGVSEKRKEEANQETGQKNYRNQPIGTISDKIYGTPAVKTEDGWIRIDRMIFGADLKGMQIVHLDRDKNNNCPENLMLISGYVHSRMAKYEFWCDDPVVNKTAILWCQLDEALNKSGFRKPKKKPEVKVKKTRRLPEPKSNTGELYIYRVNRKKNPYRVRIEREGFYFNQAFASFERAYKVRNMLLKGLKQRDI